MGLGQSVMPQRKPDTLKAYEPTVRNRIAAALMGKDAKSSDLRGHFVERLIGPTVGRPSGLTVADFVPLLGTALQANEAGRDIGTRGQRLQGGVNLAIAAIPLPAAAKGGAGKLAKTSADDLVRALKGDAVNAVAETPKPKITAYHGSPHDFDEFSLDKIGTGEGAQAYGRGLYFAEKEEVARSYRDALAPRSAADGHMYEVGIDADPNAFLDWDKPINAQPLPVRERLAPLLDDPSLAQPNPFIDEGVHDFNLPNGGRPAFDPRTGELVYRQLGNKTTATEALRDAGIPGIKYLDQGSRGAGEGSRNYVVFNPAQIRILRKYGWVPGAAVPAAAVYEMQQHDAGA